MTTPSEVQSALPAIAHGTWALAVESVSLIAGGMNSVTSLLPTSSGRFIAKWVPGDDADDLLRGAEVARAMSDRGIRAGRPLTTVAGRLTAPLLGGELVILEEVLGQPLGRTDEDLRDWGATLARVHSVSTWRQSGKFLSWLGVVGRESKREDWVRNAVDLVLAEYAGLPELTWAQLHTDPEPEAFRRDSDGDIGVIDWTGSTPGPVLYDLASAAMYAGNERNAAILISAYRSEGVLDSAQLEAYLPAFCRFRAAVQAVYFSKRLHDENFRGIAGQDENAEGLQDARILLQAAGIDLP